MRSLALYLLLCLVAPGVLLGQTQTSTTSQSSTPTSAARDPQSLQLLSQTLTSIGPAANAAQDVEVKGNILSNDGKGTQLGTFVGKARGQDFAFDTTVGSNETHYRVLRGSGSIQTSAAAQSKPLQPFNTFGVTLDILPQLSRWLDFQRPGATIKAQGQASVNGHACTVVNVVSDLQPNTPLAANLLGNVVVSVDSSSSQIISIQYRASMSNRSLARVVVENHYSNYSVLAGMQVPGLVTRYVNGRLSRAE